MFYLTQYIYKTPNIIILTLINIKSINEMSNILLFRLNLQNLTLTMQPNSDTEFSTGRLASY